MNSLLFALLSVFHAPLPSSSELPLALVYKGAGSCIENCSESAALMAEMAGMQVRYVGPEVEDETIFIDAVLWIQPGGKSSTVSANMNDKLKNAIRRFVADGGAYVGFCAGGFFATEEISSRGVAGLGILQGRNALFPVLDNPEAAQLELIWGEQTRNLYFEGGPYFMPDDVEDDVEDVLSEDERFSDLREWAHYSDGKIAALSNFYHRGKVVVSGPHPEAPPSWRKHFKLEDTDGLDYDLAIEMIRWAIDKEAN